MPPMDDCSLFRIVKVACARQLSELGAVAEVQAEALLKRATGSPVLDDTELERSVGRLQMLNASTNPNTGDFARGALVGAVTAPAVSVAGRAISGDPLLGSRVREALTAFRAAPAGKGKVRALAAVPLTAARHVAAQSAMGAFGGGAAPALKAELDREAEKRKLRKHIAATEG